MYIGFTKEGNVLMRVDLLALRLCCFDFFPFFRSVISTFVDQFDFEFECMGMTVKNSYGFRYLAMKFILLTIEMACQFLRLLYSALCYFVLM